MSEREKLEALAWVLRGSGTAPAHSTPSEHDARTILASDWYADRIAEAWDEGAQAAQEWETRDPDDWPTGDPPRNPYRGP